jgi:GNAT superfamily N-acetyltransferase
MKNFKFLIKPVLENDREWIFDFIRKRLGDEKIVYQGKVFYPHKLPGFIAYLGKEKIGLITYKINNKVFWVITINSLIEKKGVGTALIEAVKKQAKEKGIKKIKLITTNDNLDALRFYQKRGFRLKKIYPNAVDKSRLIKPSIPKIGDYGIPLKDEIELELVL